MSARFTLVLVVLLAVLGGSALLYYRQEGAEHADNTAVLGRTLLNDLDAAKVAAVRISEPQSKLTVALKGDRWVIPERGNFPADISKVRAFVVKALSLKVGQSDTVGDQDRARLNLDASGTRVEFLDASGKSLAALVVGKKYFKREVDDPAKASADGRFVGLPSDPKSAFLVSDPLAEASTKSSDWIDRSGFQVEKVKTLEVRYPEGGGWRIERDGDNADWRLASARAGEKLDTASANSASYSLGLLGIADVAPQDEQDRPLQNPVTIDATTLDGLAYDIKVGKLEGDNYPVRFNVSGTPRDAKDASRQKKLEERLAREKALSSYVLLIPKSKLDDTLKKRPDLLVKAEPKK